MDTCRMQFWRRLLIPALLLALVGLVSCSISPDEGERSGRDPEGGGQTVEVLQPTESAHRPVNSSGDRRKRLEDVEHWFYYLDFDPSEEVYRQMAESAYDMLVLEPIITEEYNTDFPISQKIDLLHAADPPKLVIAYIDIGEAEEWRTYWQADWEIGDPDWIVAEDPDGWEGNFPVAYWREEWRAIWLGESGYLQLLLDSGFDGVYLDWVEAYSDENVIWAAQQDAVDPLEEMKSFVSDLAGYARAQQPDFIVIAQNAAELTEHDDYLAFIDAIAQEQTWFDGGADNDPPGDCPLPRTEDQVDSEAYYESLSAVCRYQYEEFPESTLHVSSEWYLNYLNLALDKGVIIFTVDYALEPENVAWTYETARAMGFIPFVGERSLSAYIDPVP